jgi:hypothetical protein
MFRSKPVVRFLIPDQELGAIIEKSANAVQVDGDDTNSHDNPRRQESKRKKRKRSSRRMQGLQRAESIRKEEVSGKKRNFN